MQLPIKLIINPRPRLDGTCSISIQYCFSSERRTVLPTNIAIPAKNWNRKRMCIAANLPGIYGNAEQLNIQLLKMLRTTEDIVAFAIQKGMNDPLSFLKQTFHPEFDPSVLTHANTLIPTGIEKPCDDSNVLSQFDDYIKTTCRKVTPGMVRSYLVIKKRLADLKRTVGRKLHSVVLIMHFTKLLSTI